MTTMTAAPDTVGRAMESLTTKVATPSKALERVRNWVHGPEAVARTACALFPVADEAHDPSAAHPPTQRLTVHAQTACMWRSLPKQYFAIKKRATAACLVCASSSFYT